MVDGFERLEHHLNTTLSERQHLKRKRQQWPMRLKGLNTTLSERQHLEKKRRMQLQLDLELTPLRVNDSIWKEESMVVFERLEHPSV